jgi:hypothetical protein
MSVDFRLWHEAEMTGAAVSMENRETFCSIRALQDRERRFLWTASTSAIGAKREDGDPKWIPNAFVRLGQFRTSIRRALVRRTPFRVGHGWRDEPALTLVGLEPMQKEVKWRRRA